MPLENRGTWGLIRARYDGGRAQGEICWRKLPTPVEFFGIDRRS